ncbi:sulfatase [Candidatus Woesearchaeota archaeon]|nr:sulfatase [Candidatus Woesearchaeota archaeon]
MTTHTKPNIVFILVDALRASNLGSFGYPKPITPTLDKLAARGTTFEKCFSPTNASDPALTSLMSGMYTRSHGILHHSYEVPEKELKNLDQRNVKFLQQILKDHGYNTYALDFLARWHMRGYDYYPELKIDRTKRKRQLNRISRLFKFLHIKPLFKKISHTNTFRKLFGGFDAYPKDIDTTAKAIELINEHQQKNLEQQTTNPYFLFVHYWGVHKPYTCPDVENKRSTECYDNAIQTVDTQIAQILEAAGEDTIIVVVGDHAESLGEHGISFDHHGLYDPSLHVPLIFAGKCVPQNKRIAALTCTTDIFSTLLHLANIPYTPKTDSCNLVPLMEENVKAVRDDLYSEENYYQDKAAIRTLKHKFIKTIGQGICQQCHLVHGADIELYDLEQDPQELHNIAQQYPELIKEFSEKIDVILR